MSITKRIIAWVQHFDYDAYWKMRDYVQNYKGSAYSLKLIWYIYRIKRMDAYANASTGIVYPPTRGGAFFAGHPRLPHNLYGIMIAPGARIGKNVRIFQQVTIGTGKTVDDVPTIEDDVFIFPGAKIIGKVTIGKGAKIGANAVVVTDVPPYATVVVEKPRVIIKEKQ